MRKIRLKCLFRVKHASYTALIFLPDWNKLFLSSARVCISFSQIIKKGTNKCLHAHDVKIQKNKSVKKKHPSVLFTVLSSV